MDVGGRAKQEARAEDLTILSGTKLVALVCPKGENQGWFSTAQPYDGGS